MKPILIAKNIKKSFLKDKTVRTEVLKGIDLEIRRGEFFALMGPSGVGKTTLLYVISSLDKPDEGEVSYFLNGSEFQIEQQSIDELARIRNRHIGFVFQFHHLLPEFTSLENVAMPLLIRGVRFATAFERAKDLLARVGLQERFDHKPSELSGGEQQRVAIARALINEPDIVFADEPTGNLDTKTAESFLNLLFNLKKQYNLTFVVATHSNEIAALADRIAKMKDGIIDEIIEKPQIK